MKGLICVACLLALCLCVSPIQAGVFSDYFDSLDHGGAFNVSDASVAAAPATGLLNPAIQPKPGAPTTAQALATTQQTCALTGGVGCSAAGGQTAKAGMGGGNGGNSGRRSRR